MADVEVTYRGQIIRSMSASGTEVLHTEGKLCDDDITIDYTSPGGGGAILIASGSYVGGNIREIEVTLGTKAPMTDYIFVIYAENNSEFVYDTNYKIPYLKQIVPKDLCSFAFASQQTGYDRYTAQGAKNYLVNNSGVITSFNPTGDEPVEATLRNVALAPYSSGSTQIRKYLTEWKYYFQAGSAYRFPAVNYTWFMIYFGSSPATDIIEIA